MRDSVGEPGLGQVADGQGHTGPGQSYIVRKLEKLQTNSRWFLGSQVHISAYRASDKLDTPIYHMTGDHARLGPDGSLTKADYWSRALIIHEANRRPNYMGRALINNE